MCLRYEFSLQAHAVQNHPRSRAFFNAMQYQPQAKKEISEDLFYCCPECDFKTAEPNKFQIHALEKHPQSLAFFSGEDEKPGKNNSVKKCVNIFLRRFFLNNGNF